MYVFVSYGDLHFVPSQLLLGASVCSSEMKGEGHKSSDRWCLIALAGILLIGTPFGPQFSYQPN